VQAGECGDELAGPAPGLVDAQLQAAGAAGESGRDVQQPVAQCLGFSAGLVCV
jgi:hypothetical protein